jgi:hypothetical protein
MKARPMSRVLAAEPLRHEEFDALLDELLASIPNSFSARVFTSTM